MEIVSGPYMGWNDAGAFIHGYQKARQEAGLPPVMLKSDFLSWRNGIYYEGVYVLRMAKTKQVVKVEEIGVGL